MNVYSIYKRREVAPVGSFKHIEDTIFALVAANSEEEAIISFLQEWFDKNVSSNNPTRDKKEYIEKQKKIFVAFKCNTLECNTNNPKFLFYLDGRCDKLIQDDGLNALTYYTQITGDYVYNGAPITGGIGGRDWC